MGHHAFHVAKVHVGGRGGVGQHVLGVEDVQALVFHRAHVEVAGGDDDEALQVQRQAKAGFVPGNGCHERVHGVFGFVEVAGAHVHLQQVVGAAAAADGLAAAHQAARHQGEQVGGFLVRVYPFGKVPGAIGAVFQWAFFHQVAVGQQHGVLQLVGPQCDRVAGHHIRAVQEVGDAAEAFGLALGEEGVLADVEAHQLGVFGRCAGGEDFQVDRLIALRQVGQHELTTLHLEAGALAVDQYTGQVQVFAVQAQGLRRHIRVAAHAHAVEHAGFGRVKVKCQVNRVNPVGGCGVVLALDEDGRAFSK